MSELHCEKLTYPSADGKNTVSAKIYTMPGIEVKAVIQICHGMTEYVERYAHMAKWFAERGFAFGGNDHLGHGDTAASPKDFGFYGENHGAENVLNDMHSMNLLLHNRFPAVPVILYGHSMGSFFSRWYAEKFGDTISMLIISGTAGPSMMNNAGLALSTVVAKFKGPRHISPLILKLSNGSYDNKIPENTGDWTTHDVDLVKSRIGDTKSGFNFTASTYREMLRVLTHISTKKWAKSLRKDLPILLIAGGEDPVGNCGEGVRQVWAMLGDAGIQDLTCQIWPEGRHEMHNELNKEEVFDYVLTWIEDRL